MMKPVIVSIDQGTTNSKAVLVDETGQVVAVGSAPVGVGTPRPGWVEQDARRLWESVLEAVAVALRQVDRFSIAGVTLSTQRETVVGWHATSGVPVGPAIGWQDSRTSDWCAEHLDEQAEDLVRERTGLRVDPMFSAPKMRWLLDHSVAENAASHPAADLRLGTVDSWLIRQLTGGSLTEAGNASRTLLYDIDALGWSSELSDLFGVPAQALPEVRPSDAGFGTTKDVPGLPDGVPVLAVMADSHAAMFGHGCTRPGMAKATYGTGSSVMTPIDRLRSIRSSPVPTTLAWLTDGPTYAREGNILSSGATLAWLAGLLTGGRVGDLLALASTVPDSGGVSLVPAFSGLGAPHWDRDAEAIITGLSAGTVPAHLARAAVESIAHQICDVVEVIEADGEAIEALHADGGVSVSDLAMQAQADLLGRTVIVAPVPEVSAVGVARLGWQTLGAAAESNATAGARTFEPRQDADRDARRERWGTALRRSKGDLDTARPGSGSTRRNSHDTSRFHDQLQPRLPA